MKPFIYLVQGQAKLVQAYLSLKERADTLFLTYDEPLDGAIFFPNSTWAEGRNHLLEIARSRGAYRYTIFCDDDIQFLRGGWALFERALLRYEPAVGVPIFTPKTVKTPLRGLPYQPFLINDEQLMAFHHTVVADNILLPYQTQFDNIHWWASCRIQEVLTQNFYTPNAIQFNHIHVLNTERTRYPHDAPAVAQFRTRVHTWLTKQFVGGAYIDIRRDVDGRRLQIALGALRFMARRLFHRRPHNYSITPAQVQQRLQPDSPIRKQYHEKPRHLG
ncbi:MAG: hypothetical protein ACPG8W_01095 [Candidatus Promineifilaceae bacterium]